MKNAIGTNQYKNKYKHRSTGAVAYIAYLLVIALFTNAEVGVHSKFTGNIISPIAVRAAYADQAAPTPSFPDTRAQKVYNFLASYNSPMASEAQYFVDMADKYALDYTLMPSIAGKESSFGKQIANSFNPFGMTTGLTTGPRFRAFSSWKDAIEAEAQLLSKHYKLVSNQAIGSVYCPKSECSTTWAEDVTNFSKEITKS